MNLYLPLPICHFQLLGALLPNTIKAFRAYHQTGPWRPCVFLKTMFVAHLLLNHLHLLNVVNV